MILALARMGFLRTREKLAILEAAPDAASLRSLSSWEVTWMLGRRLREGAWNPAAALSCVEHDRLTMDRLGIRASFWWDQDFPPLLREIPQEPFLLYLRGTLPDPERPLLAVVGTRHPTPAGRTAAWCASFLAARAGLATVSGLARGIDAAAHRGSVDAGGKTVAVLGSGIDVIYPAENRVLARRILESGGCLISEYPPGTPPARFRFPERNRLISGLARGVLVAEAPARSGALITASYALEQGRDLYVSASTLGGPAGAGLRALAEDGAPVVAGAADILSGWGIPCPAEGARGPFAASPEGPGASQDRTGAALARSIERELADGSDVVGEGEAAWSA